MTTLIMHKINEMHKEPVTMNQVIINDKDWVGLPLPHKILYWTTFSFACAQCLEITTSTYVCTVACAQMHKSPGSSS